MYAQQRVGGPSVMHLTHVSRFQTPSTVYSEVPSKSFQVGRIQTLFLLLLLSPVILLVLLALAMPLLFAYHWTAGFLGAGNRPAWLGGADE
jgi:hypothetical protein